MGKKDWIDRLDDEEIFRLTEKKPKYKEISHFVDNKILNIIRDKEKIKKERKKIYFIHFTKIALSSSVIIICLLILNIIFFKNLYKFNYNRCFITEIKGNAYIKIKTGKTKNIEKIPYIVKQFDTVVSNKNSEIKLNIGINSKILLNESSALKVVKIYKKNDLEKTNLFVESGNINFNPKLVNIDSIFQVETELITINVTGTYFTVNVDNDKNTRVFVKEGSVIIKPKINKSDLEKIKKIDPEFGNKLLKILFSDLILNKGENIEIRYSEFKDIESKILEIIKSIYLEMDKNKDSAINIKEIINQLKENVDELINLRNKLLQKPYKIQDNLTEESIKEKFIISKISSSIGLSLTEKNTYINTDNNSIYISSDSNNAIYSINTLTGIIKWEFTDPDLKDITSTIIPFKDKLVLCTSNYIYILNKNGKPELKKTLDFGITYWAKCIIANNKLYIPTNKYLYYYDGNKIEKLENFPESSGQLYITYSDNKLFCFDSNELVIKIFDLNNNKVILTSSVLKERAFVEPLVTNNFIYITDIKNNLYEFDYLKSGTYQLTNINTGNLTNIIIHSNKMYFVGTNGYFYEINNNKVKKIVKVDIHPEMDKYLTKKLILYKDLILFSSDTGNIFYYDILNDKAEFLEISRNKKKLPLVGTPVMINKDIYFIDTESNIYKLSINL